MKAALLLAEAAQRLSRAGIESSRLDARVLLRHAMADKEQSLLPDEIDDPARERFLALLARRLAREPIAYIVGVKEFWSLEFATGKGVLVPRPESELLIEELRKSFSDSRGALRILDLGVGSGCLLLSALSEFPNADGVGIDRSPEAIAWARRNAETLALSARSQFLVSDWRTGIAGAFDVILVNPPYISTEDLAALEPEVMRYEPLSALDGGRDGLDSYRDLSPRLALALRPGGRSFVEIGLGQSESVRAILAGSGLEVERIAPDLAGIPRCVVARARGP